MRIITGKARGVRLDTLAGDATRPTSERAKEAIFSMLQFEIEGRRVLDLFAGSGQMGLETISRGAEFAVLVDNKKAAIEIISKNIKKTKSEQSCRTVCSDYAEYIKSVSARERFDIIFIDPPYAEKVIPHALVTLAENGLLKPTSVIVCESADEDIFTGKHSAQCKELFEIRKKARYGIANITILSPKH